MASSSCARELAYDSRTQRSAPWRPKSRPGVSATWARRIRSKTKSQLSGASAEQSASASEEMSAQAEQLKNLVSNFRLGGEHDAPAMRRAA